VYLAGSQLHIINEEKERSTFNNTRGVSNIDLTIVNNNLLTDVHNWEMSEEDSLSDHNYLKYKISVSRGETYTNKTKYRSAKYVIKKEKLQLFDSNLAQEMLKKDQHDKEGGVEEIDNYLSAAIATENDIEQSIELIEEAIKSACKRTPTIKHD